MQRLKILIPVILLLTLAPALAQVPADCPDIVQRVLEELDSVCAATDRNEACYGNIALEAEPRETVDTFNFDEEGDIEGVSAIQRLRLRAMNEEEDIWGVAVFELQTSLPDALPGENVTFLLFGDVEVINAVSDEDENLNPMQAFYLRTGLGDAACAEAPESGLLVRTPDGVGEVNFSVNGVDIGMGSTVFFQAQPEAEMTTRVYRGSAAMQTEDGVFPIIAGTQRRIPMTENLLPDGPPEAMEPYPEGDENINPVRLIPGEEERAVRPLSASQVNIVNVNLGQGRPPCGLGSFTPPCAGLIKSAGGEYCPLGEDGTLNCDVEPALPDQEIFEEQPYVPLPGDWELPEIGAEITAEPTAPTLPTEDPDATSTPQPTEQVMSTPTATVFPGCQTNFDCTSDDIWVRCQCPICGVECPAGDPPSDSSEDDGGGDETAVPTPVPTSEDDEDDGGIIGEPGAPGDPGDGGGGDPGPPTPGPRPTDSDLPDPGDPGDPCDRDDGGPPPPECFRTPTTAP